MDTTYQCPKHNGNMVLTTIMQYYNKWYIGTINSQNLMGRHALPTNAHTVPTCINDQVVHVQVATYQCPDNKGYTGRAYYLKPVLKLCASTIVV